MKKTQKIMIVDDDANICELVRLYLKKEGFDTVICQDGEKALEEFEKEKPDLAILDIMMPKIDGITVLKEFRKVNKKLPLIMLTAKSEVDDKVLGLNSGADDYLSKPFEVKELIARIHAMLRRNAGEADNTLIFEDIVLNCATFEVSSPKGSYRLNNKEYQLLETLMRSKGRILSAEALMSKIWDSESDAGINVVWTYISYLRKKIVQLTDKVEIKAVRNLGYTLEKAYD